MGMDVYGLNPKTDKGTYFRNNIWWWRPLANFLTETYPQLTQECKHWWSNDGDGLDSITSEKLATALYWDISKGVVQEYVQGYNYRLGQLGRIDCEWCHTTGIRTDDIGVEMGMPEKLLDESIAIIVGRTHGYCNACEGYGTQEHYLLNYNFNLENVQKFATFLENCGGFEIW